MNRLIEKADACVVNLNWFYSLMIVVIVGGIWLEAFLERKRRNRK